ncbi:MAG: hypothetical protein ACYCW6_02025 [Candidatus Xenobia bacterium]
MQGGNGAEATDVALQLADMAFTRKDQQTARFWLDKALETDPSHEVATRWVSGREVPELSWRRKVWSMKYAPTVLWRVVLERLGLWPPPSLVQRIEPPTPPRQWVPPPENNPYTPNTAPPPPAPTPAFPAFPPAAAPTPAPVAPQPNPMMQAPEAPRLLQHSAGAHGAARPAMIPPPVPQNRESQDVATNLMVPAPQRKPTPSAFLPPPGQPDPEPEPPPPPPPMMDQQARPGPGMNPGIKGPGERPNLLRGHGSAEARPTTGRVQGDLRPSTGKIDRPGSLTEAMGRPAAGLFAPPGAAPPAPRPPMSSPRPPATPQEPAPLPTFRPPEPMDEQLEMPPTVMLPQAGLGKGLNDTQDTLPVVKKDESLLTTTGRVNLQVPEPAPPPQAHCDKTGVNVILNVPRPSKPTIVGLGPRFAVIYGNFAPTDPKEVTFMAAEGESRPVRMVFGRGAGDNVQHVQLNHYTVSPDVHAEMIMAGSEVMLVSKINKGAENRYEIRINGVPVAPKEVRRVATNDMITLGIFRLKWIG